MINYIHYWINIDESSCTIYPRLPTLRWSNYSLKLSLEFKVWRRYDPKK